MVKETKKFDRESRVRSTHFAHFCSGQTLGTLGASWHWQVGINPRQVSAVSRMRSPQNLRAGLLTTLLTGCYFYSNFTLKETAVHNVWTRHKWILCLSYYILNK